MGLRSGVRYPGSWIRKKPIPDPGSRGQKAPDPGSGSATLVLTNQKNQKIYVKICTKKFELFTTVIFSIGRK